MSYTVDCLKTSYPAALELLCDSIINPRFHTPEVEEQKERLLQLLTNKELQMTLLNEVSQQDVPDSRMWNHIVSGGPAWTIQVLPCQVQATVPSAEQQVSDDCTSDGTLGEIYTLVVVFD